MNSRGVYALLGAVAAITAGVLLAPTTPESNPGALDALAPGTPSWGASMISSTTTTTWMRYDVANAQPACFPSGTVLVGYASTDTVLVFSQNSGAAIGDPALYEECQIEDYDGTSPGHCAVVPAGPFAFEVDQRVTSVGRGSFSGICDTPVDSDHRFDGTITYPRCEVDAHCVSAGVTGGTCVAEVDFTSTERNRALGSCSFIGFRAVASAGRFHLRIER